MPNLYFGKISSQYPEQHEENFYSAGTEGNPWYGGIKPGDFVFPIYAGKIHKLWLVREYTEKPNRINRDDSGVVIFETIREYDEPVKLSEVFLGSVK